MAPVLALLSPSLAFAWARGSGEGILIVFLAFYLLPPILHFLGRYIPLQHEFSKRMENIPPEAMALLLPYAPYWVITGKLFPLKRAYLAFLKGPGIAVPLSVLLLWPVGLYLPPLVGAIVLLVGIQLSEKAFRKWVFPRLR